MRTPKVTIGLPVYNGEIYLRSALDCILLQDYTHFELVISDNASTVAATLLPGDSRYPRAAKNNRMEIALLNAGSVPAPTSKVSSILSSHVTRPPCKSYSGARTHTRWQVSAMAKKDLARSKPISSTHLSARSGRQTQLENNTPWCASSPLRPADHFSTVETRQEMHHVRVSFQQLAGSSPSRPWAP